MTRIYIIRQRANYWHNVIEVHADKSDAVSRCSELAANDCDSHHKWFVTEHSVGVINDGSVVWDEHPENKSELEVFKTSKLEEQSNEA